MTKTAIRKMTKAELVYKLRHEYLRLEVNNLWNKNMLVDYLYDIIQIDSMTDEEVFRKAYEVSVKNGMKAW